MQLMLREYKSLQNRLPVYEKIEKWLNYIVLSLLFYCIIWTVMRPSMFPDFMTWNNWDTIEDFCHKIMLLIGLIKIYYLFDIRRRDCVFALFLLIILSLYKFISGGNSIDFLIPIIALFDTDFDDVLKCYLSAAGTSLTIVVIASLLGIIPNIVELSSTKRIVDYRNGLGFYNVDFFPAFFFFVTIAIGCMYRNSKHIVLVTITLIMATIVSFIFTAGLSASISFLLGSFAIILLIFLTKVSQASVVALKIEKIFLFFMLLFPGLAVLIDFAGIILMERLNNSVLLSVFLRYLYTYNDFVMLGMKLPIEYAGNAQLLDTNYSFWIGLIGNWDERLTIPHQANMLILIKDGFIILLEYVIMEIYTTYRLIKHKKYILLVYFNTALLFGCFESLPFRYSACALLFWLVFAKVK